MKWQLKMGREEATLNLAGSVSAVWGPTLQPSALLSVDSGIGHALSTDALPEMFDSHVSQSDRTAFETAGWFFVKPSRQTAFAAAMRTLLPGSTRARQVLISESGDILVTTNLASVQLYPEVDHAEVTHILQEDGLEIVYEFKFGVNMFEVSLPADRPMVDVISSLQAKTDRYVFAEPNLLQAITPRFKPKDPQFDKQWQHDNKSDGINAHVGICSEKAWEVTRGKDKDGRSVRIAVIDNGIDITHSDLAPGIVECASFELGPNDQVVFAKMAPGDVGFPKGSGHGTFCLGMAGARMNKGDEIGQGGCGSAPEADLIALSVAPGELHTQNGLARSISYATDPSTEIEDANPKTGADVISCSLKKANIDFSTVRAAIEFAAAKGRNELGIPILWATDNDPNDIAQDKVCSLPQVIAVGRSNKEGESTGSAFGDRLAFLAPGIDVFNTRNGNLFDHEDGTSVATPLAAGVAALVLARHPEFTAEQVRQKLIDSCRQTSGPPGHNIHTGHGILNASLAVAD